jgi:hypothetical protein
MRAAILGLALVVGLMAAAWAWPGPRGDALPQPAAAQPATSGEFVVLTMALGERRQQVSVIDAKTKCMCVYHIDAETGEIHLKSVRNLRWDLELQEFNGTSPLPREIRTLVEQH